MSTQRKYERLSSLANSYGSGEVPAAVHAAGRERLIGALAKRRAPSRARTVVVVSAFAAAAAIAILFGVTALRDAAAPLGWHVDGAAEVAGDYVRTDAADAIVRFDNGASCALAAGSRGRVTTKKNAANVVLERGRARVESPRLGMAWLVQAGPYALTGDGAFEVAWSDEALDLRVRRGAIVVKGPEAQDGVTLREGQHLTARGGELRVESATADATPVESAAPLPSSAPSADPIQLPPVVVSSDPKKPDGPTWSQRVAKGDYAGVLADANDRGIPTVIATAPLGDLVALADAARYARRNDVAKQALLAQRSRFAGSGPARTAAFLLGRIAEDAEGNPSAAIGWYDRYLAESPSGSFAAEALGRKMTAVARTQGNDAARPIAEQYLRRYPDGPYAAAARRVMGL